MMGMLAWFVNQYQVANALTPESILILFIASVLALAWAIFTLFSYHRSSANAWFVAFVDAGFFGTLIAGVYELRGIAHANCTNVTDSTWTSHIGDFTISGPGLAWHTNKPCAMLKASWVFGIINIVLFALTAVVAFLHGGHMGYRDDRRNRDRSPSHYSRHSHRHRSHSGSRTDRRSSHSHRRVYV